MRLSTKGRYAVTAMLDLAIHDKLDTVTLADISQCQGISLSYLEQLFAKLRKHHLVQGVRGPGGGYRLSKSSDQITIAQIIAAVDERPTNRDNVRSQSGVRCLTDELWNELSDKLYHFLNGITLADFADRSEVQEAAQRQDRQYQRHLLVRRPAA